MDARDHVSDEKVQAVKAAGYIDEAIIKILAHVALQTFTNYFIETVLTEIGFPAIGTNNITQKGQRSCAD